MTSRNREKKDLDRRESNRPLPKRAWNLRIIIASVLVLPLILAAVIPVAAPHDGYHAVAKFQTVGIPPGERVDDEFGTAPRSWLAKSPHSNQPGNTISFFGYSEIGSYRNTFQLFYSLIPIRKWTGVFVI